MAYAFEPADLTVTGVGFCRRRKFHNSFSFKNTTGYILRRDQATPGRVKVNALRVMKNDYANGRFRLSQNVACVEKKQTTLFFPIISGIYHSSNSRRFSINT